MFVVEESGKEIEQHDNEENLIQKFVEFIKVRKYLSFALVTENNSLIKNPKSFD